MPALEEMAPEPYHDEHDDGSSLLGSDDSGFESASDDDTTRHTEMTRKTDSSSEDIGKEGRGTVLGSKMLVLVVLGIAAAAVGWTTFKQMNIQEKEDFERQVSS